MYTTLYATPRWKTDHRYRPDWKQPTSTQGYWLKTMNDGEILSGHRGAAYVPLCSWPRLEHKLLQRLLIYAWLWQQAVLNDKIDCHSREWSSDFANITKNSSRTLEIWNSRSAFRKEVTSKLTKLPDNTAETASQDEPIAYTSDKLICIIDESSKKKSFTTDISTF